MHDHPDFPSVIGGGCIHFTEQTLLHPDLALSLSRNVFFSGFVFAWYLLLHVTCFFWLTERAYIFSVSGRAHDLFWYKYACQIFIFQNHQFLLKFKWSTPKQFTLLIWLPGPGGPYRTHYLHSRFGIGHKHRRAVKLKNEMLRMFYNRYLSCLVNLTEYLTVF